MIDSSPSPGCYCSFSIKGCFCSFLFFTRLLSLFSSFLHSPSFSLFLISVFKKMKYNAIDRKWSHSDDSDEEGSDTCVSHDSLMNDSNDGFSDEISKDESDDFMCEDLDYGKPPTDDEEEDNFYSDSSDADDEDDEDEDDEDEVDEDEDVNVEGQLPVGGCAVEGEATTVVASINGVAPASGGVVVSINGGTASDLEADCDVSAVKASDGGEVKASDGAKGAAINEAVVKASDVTDEHADSDEDVV